ncbi:hypothetical protein [Halomonas sp. ND22Bw]|uniref:hypothetical protein n=1 Tax=Halomonas sp. ND22Bw TaxID=2054178 RepID=UPI0011B283F4
MTGDRYRPPLWLVSGSRLRRRVPVPVTSIIDDHVDPITWERLDAFFDDHLDGVFGLKSRRREHGHAGGVPLVVWRP